MAFNNVPANGWPQIKDLEKLDAIAKQIEDMPTFSSSDRDWLDEWEDKLPELPDDPETDGVKVLTATTLSGETVKSWEEPESGNVDYSTSEVDTGIRWTDGKTIYRRVVNIGALPDSSTKTITLGLTIDTLIRLQGSVKAGNSGFLPLPYTTFDGSTSYATWVSIDNNGDLVVTDNGPFGTAGYNGICIIEYTKVTV